ncbi:MAG TPA: family 14 glycosylhydrolase [Armatimonadota bacterium]|nr:family 14 glycosylhydrolase [Armatimonadota bacterium]
MRRGSARILLLMVAILLPLIVPVSADRIWIEAENANAQNFSGVFDFPGIVSGDKILRLWEEREPGADGYTASYEFAVSSPGMFHVWVAASVPPSPSNFWWKLDGGNISAIYLGIYGDFGEVHYPAGYHADEIRRFGKEGAGHHDWWCADEYARQHFRSSVQRKYKTIAALNEAWDAKVSGFDKVGYPPLDAKRETPGQRRQWLDFVGWYYDSMTRYCASVCRIARKHFPDAMLMIPLGCGDEALTHGQDNSALPRIVRKYGVHIRSTHGGYLPMPQNYASMLRRIASACKFYKAPLRTEPPGGISVEGEVSRFFESISCGSFGYWDWGMNPTNAQHVFEKYGTFLTTEQPVVDVALFYPTTDRRLHPEFTYPPRFREGASAIRDVMDFDILDERMVEDGALGEYRVLVLFEGNFVESGALRKIETWVKSGGVIVSYNFGPIASVEGDASVWRRLFGIPDSAAEAPGGVLEDGNEDFPRRVRSLPDAASDKSIVGLLPGVKVMVRTEGRPVIWDNRLGRGYAFYFAGSWDCRRTYYELLCDVVHSLSDFEPKMKNAVEVDAEWDGVYCTLLPSGEVIVHNFNDQPAAKGFAGKLVQLEPKSLASVTIEHQQVGQARKGQPSKSRD